MVDEIFFWNLRSVDFIYLFIYVVYLININWVLFILGIVLGVGNSK